jgi:formamidopyrimidine-DNA glycosylase
MPELPEVETVVRGLQRTVLAREIGRVECRVAKLREPLAAPQLARALRGRRLISVVRRAKFILGELDNGKILVIHLGMTGSLRLAPVAEAVGKHDQVLFYFAPPGAAKKSGAGKSGAARGTKAHAEKLVYRDPRRFGLIKIFASRNDFERRQKLGPEPLEKEFHPAYLAQKSARARTPIKVEIMKQEVVVGVGNIYASEALHRARIAPTREARSLQRDEFSRLVRAIKKILAASIALGGTTISDYRQLSGDEGNFSQQLRVYGRAAQQCLRAHCGGEIRKITQGGRTTYFCPQCQK